MSTALQLFQGRTEYPVDTQVKLTPGLDNGVYIVIPPQGVDAMAPMFESWFSGRSEVEVVDSGTSDKQGQGFILVEWYESDVDQLFIDILETEAQVIDYTLYSREVE